MQTVCVDVHTVFMCEIMYALASGRGQNGKNDFLFFTKSGKRQHPNAFKHSILSVYGHRTVCGS